jgi:Tannase and feruloyl esterase
MTNLTRYAVPAAMLAIAACGRASTAPVAPPAPVDASSAGGALGATSCEGLLGLALPHVTLREAHVVPASAATGEAPALPASCRVQGMSKPTADSDIRFEVAIPAKEAWNGNYLQVGNGGFAGGIPEDDILEGLAQGYAVAGTDDGHESQSGTDASWALGHPEKVIDFGYRALKETTDAARAIVRAHTGRAPARSYFTGCSDGGREALMEAQRYPDDFDGIVAGAPANDWTHLFVGGVWALQALAESPGSYVGPEKLRALEGAALHACGDEDGVIEDPLSCQFDPAVLRCKGAEDSRCLTDAQIKAVRAIYAGPKNPRTSAAIFPGYEPGSEAERGGWRTWLVGRARGPEGGAAFQEFTHNFFGYVVFGDPSYDVLRMSFDADVATTDAKAAAILNSSDADLGPFQRHGGKLIQYHGWGDAAIPPRDSIAYYEAVKKKMGDTSAFYRLFLAPGMLHCSGGAGPDVLSTLPAIADWVERGKAPDRVLATKMAGEGASARADRTRPLCPYPLLARWDGKGDRKRAESYTCAASSAAPR